MISMENNNIIININGRKYNINNHDEYTEFLIWITNPDPNFDINEGMFDIVVNSSQDELEIMHRYREFLIKFIKYRKELITTEEYVDTYEQCETKINTLINELKGNIE